MQKTSARTCKRPQHLLRGPVTPLHSWTENEAMCKFSRTREIKKSYIASGVCAIFASCQRRPTKHIWGMRFTAVSKAADNIWIYLVWQSLFMLCNHLPHWTTIVTVLVCLCCWMNNTLTQSTCPSNYTFQSLPAFSKLARTVESSSPVKRFGTSPLLSMLATSSKKLSSTISVSWENVKTSANTRVQQTGQTLGRSWCLAELKCIAKVTHTYTYYLQTLERWDSPSYAKNLKKGMSSSGSWHRWAHKASWGPPRMHYACTLVSHLRQFVWCPASLHVCTSLVFKPVAVACTFLQQVDVYVYIYGCCNNSLVIYTWYIYVQTNSPPVCFKLCMHQPSKLPFGNYTICGRSRSQATAWWFRWRSTCRRQ